MVLSVRFEDRYGIYDLAMRMFDIPVGPDNEPIIKDSNLKILHGLGNDGVFKPTTLNLNISEIDKLILVYDMDPPGGTNDTFLSAGRFNKKLKLFRAQKIIDKCLFVPVVFCSETIMANLEDPYTIDFSKTYSKVNTSHMHETILHDQLELRLHKKELNTKKVHEYAQDKISILKLVHILCNNTYSDLNESLFNWLESENIKDTSSLLDFNDALKLQEEYERRFRKAIKNGSTGVVYRGIQYE